MKIIIDIGHPAHVHYFRNIIKIMEANNHEFFIVARDKEVSHALLKKYKIDFKSRGRGRNNLLGKIIYTIQADLILLNFALKWKPDVLLSFSSPYLAHVSKVIGKPHIALTDTEHANLGIIAFAPFTDTIITPDCFLRDFKNKQIRFNGYFELGYLAPKYFIGNKNILENLGITKNQKVVLFRYVSWGASHDVGQSGIPDKMKLKLINIFVNKGYEVLISAEGKLLDEFEKYRVNISPDKIHDLLNAIDIFIGESGTMATEAAILGTPSIYVNSLNAGVFEDEVKYGLLYSYRDTENLVYDIEKLINTPNLKNIHLKRRNEMLKDKIDVTSFLIWFIENYPKSLDKIKENPDYQLNFMQNELYNKELLKS